MATRTVFGGDGGRGGGGELEGEVLDPPMNLIFQITLVLTDQTPPIFYNSFQNFVSGKNSYYMF